MVQRVLLQLVLKRYKLPRQTFNYLYSLSFYIFSFFTSSVLLSSVRWSLTTDPFIIQLIFFSSSTIFSQYATTCFPCILEVRNALFFSLLTCSVFSAIAKLSSAIILSLVDSYIFSLIISSSLPSAVWTFSSSELTVILIFPCLPRLVDYLVYFFYSESQF